MILFPLRWFNISLLALLFIFSPPLVLAQSLEQKLKAAFLYRFTQFVDWPPQVMTKTDGELVLCLWGEDSFDGALSDIEGKSVGERRLAIRYIEKPQQVNQCHIVFVNQPRSAWDEVQQYSQKAHVLTVSDHKDFAVSGGMIELIRADKRIQFTINLTAAKASALHISAQLLKLARHVYANQDKPK